MGLEIHCLKQKTSEGKRHIYAGNELYVQEGLCEEEPGQSSFWAF